jgi:predicted amidohydrolase YtcJ
MKADLIVRNARIHTLAGTRAPDDGTTPSAIPGSLAVARGTVLAVGPDEDMAALKGAGTLVIDAGGRTVIPGLTDGHAHMDREGLKESLPSLAGVRSIAEIQTAIAGLAAATPKGEWIVTMPVGTPPAYADAPGSLAEGRFPTRQELDAAAPDHPVFIRSIWGPWRHTLPLVSIANSRALAAANVTRFTQPPAPSVEIEKDAAGEPTGRFIDKNLLPVVEHSLMRCIPKFTHTQRVTALRRSMELYAGFGTTCVFEGHGTAAEVIECYKAVRAADAMRVRARLLFSPSWKSVAGCAVEPLIETWAGWLSGQGLGDDWLRVFGLFVDVEQSAENDARTLSLPATGWAGFYFDSSGTRDFMLRVLTAAARNGIRAGGIKPDILELFADVTKRQPIGDLRWILGHITNLDDAEIKLAKALGLVLTTHTNRYIFKQGAQTSRKLGPDRENEIVPLLNLMRAGVPFALATDNVPISLFHPLWHAIARPARGEQTRVAPGQALTRYSALWAATRGGAWLTGDERQRGSLEPGKWADLAILDADPLGCAEERIADIRSDLTVVGGRIAYDSGALDFRRADFDGI